MNNKFLTGSEIFLIFWIITIILKFLGYITLSWWIILLPIWLFLGISIFIAVLWMLGFMLLVILLIIKFIKGN